MNVRLACADFTFPLLSHDNALQLIGMLGVTGVDVGLFEGRSHLWPSRELADLPRSAGRLKGRLDDLGLVVADIFLQMDPDFEAYAVNHPDAIRRAHARDWFQHTIEYASRSGAAHVTTLPGVSFPDEPPATSFTRATEELAWRVEKAAAHGITLGVEAHVGSIVPDPVGAARLVAGVPGLTLTLDYTHFTRLGVPDERVEPLIPLASHFHIRGAREGRLQTRFADNTIDYARVLRAMRQSGYRGWLGIEYVWLDWERCNECDNVSETILFRDFLLSQAKTLDL